MLEFSPQIELLGRVMDASQVRHQVISQNLANVNTPGYQRLEVSFEDQLRESLRHPDASAGRAVEPVIRRQAGLPARADGNNVDIDLEIGELNRNAVLYQTYVQVLSTLLSQMRAATSGP